VPLPHPISDELLGLTARWFHLLGEPMRLRLLDQLRDGEATVQELADELETSQQNVSKHLGMLAEAGILARRKDGTRVQHRIGDEEVLGLCEHMCGSLEHELRGLAALADDLAARPVALNLQQME
jgi:DNA-binding transcriptional ArsR family regulator